jgi:hypothetical protein
MQNDANMDPTIDTSGARGSGDMSSQALQRWPSGLEHPDAMVDLNTLARLVREDGMVFDSAQYVAWESSAGLFVPKEQQFSTSSWAIQESYLHKSHGGWPIVQRPTCSTGPQRCPQGWQSLGDAPAGVDNNDYRHGRSRPRFRALARRPGVVQGCGVGTWRSHIVSYVDAVTALFLIGQRCPLVEHRSGWADQAKVRKCGVVPR